MRFDGDPQPPTPPRRTAAERRLRILERVADLPGDETAAGRLGDVCAEVTGTTGAGIVLIAGDLPQVSFGATNPTAQLIERLEHELGEGPCLDAHALGHPVLEPHLAAPAQLRWPAFRVPVLDAGVGAVFGFPMRVGAARLGALNLHRSAPGPLTDDQHADALAMAEVASLVVLGWQAGAPSGRLAAELDLEVGAEAVVHQATGRVAVQLGVSITHAMLRLRAHAFVEGRSLHDVACRVVDGTLASTTTRSTHRPDDR